MDLRMMEILKTLIFGDKSNSIEDVEAAFLNVRMAMGDLESTLRQQRDLVSEKVVEVVYSMKELRGFLKDGTKEMQCLDTMIKGFEKGSEEWKK